MEHILEKMRNIDFTAKNLYIPKLNGESFNISEKSLFLDIGSGFGKPVFHAAFSVGCNSWGIEILPPRV